MSADAARGVKRSREEFEGFSQDPEMQSAYKRPKTTHFTSIPFADSVSQVVKWEHEGVELQKAGKHAEAFTKFILACRDPLASSESRMRLWTLIAISHSVQGEINKTINCYRMAMTMEKDVSNPHLKLIVAYDAAGTLMQRRQEGDVELAIEILKNIIPSAQQFVQKDKSLVERIYAELACALLIRNQEGDALDAIKYAQAGIALKPKNPDRMAWFLYSLGDGLAHFQRHQDAVKCYERALYLPGVTDEDLKPHLAKHYKYSLTQLMLSIKSNLERLDKQEPSNERARAIALDYFNSAPLFLKRQCEGDFERAIRCYQIALSQKFDDRVLRAQICYHLGLALMVNLKVNAPEAVKCFSEALQVLEAADLKLRFHLLLAIAAAQVAVKKTPEAIKSLETALTSYDCTPLVKAKILLRVGMLYKDIGEKAKGDESLKRAQELAQGDLSLQQQIQDQLKR